MSAKQDKSLHDACAKGQSRKVQEILQKNTDIANRLDLRIGFLGYTPLHEAACQGHDDILQLLLLYGGNVNTKANGNYTPLHIAAAMDYVKCIKVLLKNGANIKALDDFNKTPYQTAIQHKRKESAKCLKSAEIIQAAGKDSLELKNLLNETATKDITTSCFDDALIEACHRGQFDAACMLLVAGAVKIKESIRISVRDGHYRISALLLLCYAALSGDVVSLEMLLDKSLECYEWLQQFIDEAVPIGTVIEKIRETLKNMEDYTRVAIQLPGLGTTALKKLLLNTSCRVREKIVNWSKLSLSIIHESWLVQIKSWVQYLNLSHNKLTSLPKTIVDLKMVNSFNLSKNKLKIVPVEVFSLISLRDLNLSGNAIAELPEVPQWRPVLKSFNVSDNNLSSLPASITQSRIETLNLSGNNFTRLPLSVCEITTLKSLDLSDNREINYLPVEMGKLRNLSHINLKNLDQIAGPPEQVRQVAEVLLSRLRTKLRNCEPYYMMKLMLVGRGGQGKITLVPRLRDYFTFKENDLTQDVVSSSKSESSTKESTASFRTKMPLVESQTKAEEIYREFCQMKGLNEKLTIENYHSMLFGLNIAVCVLESNNVEHGIEQKPTCRRSLKIVIDELLTIEPTLLVLESVTHIKKGVVLLQKWLMVQQTYGDESDLRQSIRSAFEAAFEKASEAFFSESLSTASRILVSKLRIISKILESFSEPEAAALGCLQVLQELHDLHEIKDLFSPLDAEGTIHLNQHAIAIYKINIILFEFVRVFLKPPPAAEEWPATIQLDGKNYNPLNEERFLETKLFDEGVETSYYSVPVIESCKQAVNSIKIDEQGGCFCVLAVGAFLVFPPNAVQGEVTLTCSRVKYKECEVKPRDGEAFVSRILKIEPEGMVFSQPVTILLSHSAYEDQDFVDFYELVVMNINSGERQELKTERISSVEGVPKEIGNPEIFSDDLPFAKATIYETCTLVAVARFKSHQVLVPTNRTRIFSKKFGEDKEVKITFPAGATEKILCLTVQLFPADAVLKRDVYLDDNLVCAPIIKVSGQMKPFLKPVDVELVYSDNDVANIEEDFLPVGVKTQFTTEYGLLLRSYKETESKSKCLQTLNESNEVYIERLTKNQLKFSFSVEHFCNLCPTTKKCAIAQLPNIGETCIVNQFLSPNLKYSAFVWAVHYCENNLLYAVLAPKAALRDLEAKWKIAGKLFGSKLKPEEKIYVCVPLESDASHLPLNDCVLRFDDEDDYELPNNTSEDVHLDKEYMYFLVRKCIGSNHDLDEDGRVKVLIHNFKEKSNKENNQLIVNEPLPKIEQRPENDVSASQEITQNGHITSQNETMRRNISRCEYFEEKVEEIFVAKLGMNKIEAKNPDVGAITRAINDAGAVTGVILGLGVGVTIALSVGSFGIGSIVGATVAGVTFTVAKVDRKLKKCYAKKIDEKLEIYFHCHLKCIIKDVAKELSRMFEYQLFALEDEQQVKVLAECAVDMMLDLKKGDQFNRNALLKKVLQDGSMKKRELLTRNKNKWLAPDVFRKPGLRRMNVGTDRAELKYFVKPENACDTNTYGYRGQFLEKKKYCVKNEEDEKVEVIRFRKKSCDNDSHTCEDPQLCKDCSCYDENCTSGHYFVESSIDIEYSEPRDEILTYQPVHILIQCPKVLDSFISNLQTEKPSLANFLKTKLGLPMDHVVHPVYRQHSPGKGPDLKKSILTGSDFSHSDFTNSSLEECDFTNCVMLFAELAGAKLSGSRFVDTLISHSNLAKVEADHCEWTKTFLLYSRVDGANLDSVVPTVGGNCFHGTNICDAITAIRNETPV